MPVLLSETSKLGSYRIINIQGEETTRLLEMGVTPGLELDVIRRAPTGFPLEIKVRGYLLTLREQEAKCIQIEAV